jgi:hypothetical protein
MTIPSEEKGSLEWAWKFLHRLMYANQTPRVPFKIRKEAAGILRHYPGPVKIGILYEAENPELVRTIKEWLHTPTLLLRAGELSVQEIRTVKAVLNAILREMGNGERG